MAWNGNVCVLHRKFRMHNVLRYHQHTRCHFRDRISASDHETDSYIYMQRAIECLAPASSSRMKYHTRSMTLSDYMMIIDLGWPWRVIIHSDSLCQSCGNCGWTV